MGNICTCEKDHVINLQDAPKPRNKSTSQGQGRQITSFQSFSQQSQKSEEGSILQTESMEINLVKIPCEIQEYKMDLGHKDQGQEKQIEKKAVSQIRKKNKKHALPANVRNLVYAYLDFKSKFRMIYLCRQEYKFLGEWKLYEQPQEQQDSDQEQQILYPSSDSQIHQNQQKFQGQKMFFGRSEQKNVQFTFSIDIQKALKYQLKALNDQQLMFEAQEKHSKNSLQLVRNLTQIVNLQINDFSRLSADNMEMFLKELYTSDYRNQIEEEKQKTDLDLKEKMHNVPEICIEIDMQKLQFRHSISGPKIFEICGKDSIYNKFVTRLSFISQTVPSLYSAKVFPKCLSQMSQVKEISIKIMTMKYSDTCLNLQNCQNIQKLNFDIGLSLPNSFQSLMKQCFNQYTDLALPKIFIEKSMSECDESYNASQQQFVDREAVNRIGPTRNLEAQRGRFGFQFQTAQQIRGSQTSSSSENSDESDEFEHAMNDQHQNLYRRQTPPADEVGQYTFQRAGQRIEPLDLADGPRDHTNLFYERLNRQNDAHQSDESYLAEDEEFITLKELNLTIRNNIDEELLLNSPDFFLWQNDVFNEEELKTFLNPEEVQIGSTKKENICNTHMDLFPKFQSRTAFACSVTIINFEIKRILKMHEVITLSPDTVQERQMSSLEPIDVKISELLEGVKLVSQIGPCLRRDIQNEASIFFVEEEFIKVAQEKEAGSQMCNQLTFQYQRFIKRDQRYRSFTVIIIDE